MNGRKPQFWVVAGPNGAGKSTLVARHAFARQIPIINPDDIARQISPGHRGEVAVIGKAGRQALMLRKGYMDSGISFGIETTLTGRGELELMRQARNRGYKVNVVYVGLKSADQSNSRVSIRARNGGHDVPEVDVIRRFDRSLANLPGAIQEADRAFVLDNSARQYRLLASIENGSLRFVSKDLPDWAVAVLQKVGLSSL